MRVRATSIVLKNNKLLMMHRINNGAEYWVLPGGGVEDGEEVEKAVLRELQEETSIEAELGEKLLEFADSRGDRHILFLCRHLAGEPKLHDESQEAKVTNVNQSYSPEWVDIYSIPNLTIYPVEEKVFLIKYLNIKE